MKNGKIAIPSIGNGGLEGQRAGHFGHCEVFTVVDVKDGEIKNVSIIQNQEHVQGGCMVPVNLLASHKVNALIVGGIGLRPLMGFQQAGIRVFHENTQVEIKAAVEELILGKLSLIDNEQVCGGGGTHTT